VVDNKSKSIDPAARRLL